MSFLKSFFKKKEERSIRSDFEKLGLTVISDERLRERLASYKELYDYIQKHTGIAIFDIEDSPEKKLKKLNDFTHKINEIIQIIAIPWLRAGDEKVREGGRLIIRGWNKLYSLILDLLTGVDHLLTSMSEKGSAIEPRILKEELIRKTVSFIQKFYVPYALMITGVSFVKEDVSPAWSVVIQSLPTTAPPYAFEEGVKDMREEYEKMRMELEEKSRG